MATLNPPLRWGILGCARIARRGLIPGIRASTSGVLLALASRDQGRATQWAREFAVPRAHASYEAALADSEIDAVYIPLPNELHKPWVMAAADAGKHVLCEKPLALDSQEAAAMVEHCRQRGVILMEAFMWRHQPRTLEIRKRVRDGAIGDLRLIRSSFSFPIEPGDWRLDPARGGGALWDVGCYGVSTARLFAGAEPRMVRALAHFSQSVDVAKTHHAERDDYELGQSGVDVAKTHQAERDDYELGQSGVNVAKTHQAERDVYELGQRGGDVAKTHQAERDVYELGQSGVDLTLTALLEFDSGVLATIDCSFEQPFRCQYELVGSRGSVGVPDAYLPPKAGKPTALLRSLGAASDSSSGGDRVEVLEFEPADQYAEMVDAFSRSVAAGTLVDPAEDGLEQMRVLDQVSREARSACTFRPPG